MISKKGHLSIGTAALITGLTLFIPTAPYAEFFVFKKLLIHSDAAQTARNLTEHSQLFLSGIFAIFFTLLEDILLAWTLYIFLKPVHPLLSLLTGWFRLVSTILAMVALLNFLNLYQLINLPVLHEPYHDQEILQLVHARRIGNNLAYIVFGIYQILVGILIWKSSYVPKVLGIAMIVAGISWIAISVQPFLFPTYNIAWLMYFSIGELFFYIWLLVKGRKVKESEIVELRSAGSR